jgi:hypothetical protein
VGALVLRRVGLLAATGIAIGTALGMGLGSLMSGILFGVESYDPFTMMAAMTAMASRPSSRALQLRHAVRVRPAKILRAE